MRMTRRQSDFVNSAAGQEARELLVLMMKDERYNTVASYSANTELYPDHLVSFVEKHMHYLREHPNINPQQYISNLRLMTKITG